MGRSSWDRQQCHVCLCHPSDKHWYIIVVCWSETCGWDHEEDGRWWRRVCGLSNRITVYTRRAKAGLSALLREMTQIKYFIEKLVDNNWSNITVLLKTEMKRLQKVAFDELLPKMALRNAFSTSFYNVLMIWITPNFVSLIFCV